MTFVFPILLGGLLLAGVPILLHLLMRQKPKTLSFPAFRFLVQKRRTNLRKLRLRHLLLLALRILLIVLICLALGGPRLYNDTLNLSSERPIAGVLVFDTSMSMEYSTSDKLSRLQEAKKRGQEFVQELPSGSRVVILDSADAALSNRGDWLISMSQAEKRIGELQLRPGAASVLPALEYAYRILGELARADDSQRYLPRLVCVFSDRTRASWEQALVPAAETAADQVPPSLEGLQHARSSLSSLVDLLKQLRQNLPPPPGKDYPEQALIDALEQLAPLLPGLSKADFPLGEPLSSLTMTIERLGRQLLHDLAPSESAKEADDYRSKLIANLQEILRDLRGAQGLFIDVGIEHPVDQAILRLDLPFGPDDRPRQVFSPKEKLMLRALVQATGQSINTTLTCKLENNSFQQPIEIKAGEQRTIHFEIDCGALKLEPGPHQAEVRLEADDLLPFNNRRYVTFAIREPRRVLVITEDVGRAHEFLKALKALGYAAESAKPQDLSKVESRSYQAVYLFEVPDPGKNTWEFLLSCIQRGLGVGIVPGGNEIQKDDYNSKDAAAVMPGRLTEIVAQGKDDREEAGAIWNLDDAGIFQHPLMAPFRNWREADVVKNPGKAFIYWKVTPDAQESLVVVSYKKSPKSKEKLPAVVERRLPSVKNVPGKILLFTTPLDARAPRWNNYLESSMFVVLVGLSTNYLAGDSEAPNFNFHTGQQEPVVNLPPTARFPAYTLLRLGRELQGQDRIENVTAPDRPGLLKLRQAEAPGNYVLEGRSGEAGPGQRVAVFSVNVPPEESDLTRVTVSQVEGVLGSGAVVPADRKADIRAMLKNHWNEPVDLFPLFMVIVLVMLALENLLANKFYRHDKEPLPQFNPNP